MAFAHPGVVESEETDDGPIGRYKVRALVMHVVRRLDNLGNPVVTTYNRGDTALLTSAYALPYVKERLLEPLAPEPAEEEPPPPRSKKTDGTE